MGARVLNSEFKFVHEHDSGGGKGFLASSLNQPMRLDSYNICWSRKLLMRLIFSIIRVVPL